MGTVRIERGITLLAPWDAMILYAGKDVENRGEGRRWKRAA
jgi:hypothetical protein